MRCGPKVKLEYLRFEPLRGVGACVYLTEFGDLLKVGWSANAWQRMRLLSSQARREGRVLGRYAAWLPVNGMHATECELEAINLLNQVGEPVPGCVEYFRGVDFDTGVRLLSTGRA